MRFVLLWLRTYLDRRSNDVIPLTTFVDEQSLNLSSVHITKFLAIPWKAQSTLLRRK